MLTGYVMTRYFASLWNQVRLEVPWHTSGRGKTSRLLPEEVCLYRLSYSPAGPSCAQLSDWDTPPGALIH